MNDWSLAYDGERNVILIMGTHRLDLGPRDTAFTRFADFMGEDFAEKEWVEPPSMGEAG